MTTVTFSETSVRQKESVDWRGGGRLILGNSEIDGWKDFIELFTGSGHLASVKFKKSQSTRGEHLRVRLQPYLCNLLVESRLLSLI